MARAFPAAARSSLVLLAAFLFCVAAVGEEPSGSTPPGPGGGRSGGWQGDRFHRSEGWGGRFYSPPKSPSDPIESGFVVVENTYIPPPYVLSVEQDALLVNGKVVVAAAAPAGPSEPGLRRFPGSGRGRVWRDLMQSERALREGGLLVSFKGGSALLMSPFSASQVLAVLVDRGLSDTEKVERLRSLFENETPGQPAWDQLVAGFRPTDDLVRRTDELRRAFEPEPAPAGKPQPSALAAGIASYVSIALGTVALGLLISHFPPRGHGWKGRDASPEGTRRVVRLVCLLAVLNAFDLACTLAASASGTMTELNPLVHRFLSTPLALVAFKVTVVAAALATLLAARRYRMTQGASWIACAVYTIVVLRWATFHSLLLS